MASKRLTDWAQAWHDDGCDDKRVIDNVTDELMYDILEAYDLEPSDHEEAKLEMLLRGIVTEQIDWEEIAENDRNARDYDDARRSAIYE